MTLQNEVLKLWFGELTEPHEMGPNVAMWWKKDPELDAQLKERFEHDVEQAAAGAYDAWLADPREALALVIVLDQFSRNIYRLSPKSWSNDAKAVAVMLEAIERGHHEKLRTVERQFLFMPFMHSEDSALHQRGLKLIEQTLADVPEAHREPFEPWRKSAHLHAEIVTRFGRYPHRNGTLKRDSTAEEIAFLSEPNSSF